MALHTCRWDLSESQPSLCPGIICPQPPSLSFPEVVKSQNHQTGGPTWPADTSRCPSVLQRVVAQGPHPGVKGQVFLPVPRLPDAVVLYFWGGVGSGAGSRGGGTGGLIGGPEAARHSRESLRLEPRARLRGRMAHWWQGAAPLLGPVLRKQSSVIHGHLTKTFQGSQGLFFHWAGQLGSRASRRPCPPPGAVGHPG